MSCDDCERAHETGRTYPLRVGNGTVSIVACDKHATELIEAYREQLADA